MLPKIKAHYSDNYGAHENTSSVSENYAANYLRYPPAEERNGARYYLDDVGEAPELPVLQKRAAVCYEAAEEWESNVGVSEAARDSEELGERGVLGEHRGRVESSWSDSWRAGAGVVKA